MVPGILCFVFGVWCCVRRSVSRYVKVNGLRNTKNQTQNTKHDIAWILHGPEAFIGKAHEGEIVMVYFESSLTLHMKVSGSPLG